MIYRISKKGDRINGLCKSKDSKLAILVFHDSTGLYDGVIYDRVQKTSYVKKNGIPYKCLEFSMDDFKRLNIQYDSYGCPFIYGDHFDNVVKKRKIVQKHRKINYGRDNKTNKSTV